MKFIKCDDAEKGTNIDKCKTIEYSFGDKDIDLGISIITGRYPENGYCVNLVSKELIYVIEGAGEIYYENKSIKFSKGDSILINNNEKYYWNSNYCKVNMCCTPAWTIEQYKIIENDRNK